MDINKRLEFLSLASEFSIEKDIDEDKVSYEVSHNNSDLVASIDSLGEIKYYLSGCYNSGVDYIKIEMSELDELQSFCELLSKEIL